MEGGKVIIIVDHKAFKLNGEAIAVSPFFSGDNMKLIANPSREQVTTFAMNVSRTDAFEVSLVRGVPEHEAAYEIVNLKLDKYDQTYVIEDDSSILAYGGFNTKSGLAWFLLSRSVICLKSDQKFQLARLFYQMRNKAIIKAEVGYMHNVMLAANRQHKDFLTKLGAEFGLPITISGHEFLPFTIK